MALNADLLVTAASVVTVDPSNMIYSPGAIAVEGARIVAVGPAEAIVGQVTAARRIDAPRSFVFPGLINTHNHLWQTLLKGLGDDMGLIAWIEATLRPTMPLLDDDLCYLGACVGALEAARSGCTTTLDFMHHIPCTSAYEQIFRAFDDVGGNVVLGRALRDQLPSAQVAPGDLNLDGQIQHTRELFMKYGRDRVWLAPGTVWGMTKAGLRRVREVANELDALITIHLNEVAFDSEEAMRRFGMRSLPFLESIGFLGTATPPCSRRRRCSGWPPSAAPTPWAGPISDSLPQACGLTSLSSTPASPNRPRPTIRSRRWSTPAARRM